MAERLAVASRVLERVPEIQEDQAEEAVRRTYGDIRRTLRIPQVNLMFRILGNWPGFLVPAWGSISPVMGTRRAEEQCDTLRRYTAYQVSSGEMHLDGPLRTDPDISQIRGFVDTMHYALPKNLVVAQLMARLLDPDDQGAKGAPEGPVLEPGPVEEMVMLPLLDERHVEGRIHRVFTEVRERHDHPKAASFYRGLAAWPDVLELVWEKLAPTVGTGEYRYVSRRLQLKAYEVAVDVPLRRPRGWELVEQVRDEVHAVLDLFRTCVLPDLMQDVTRVKAWLDGEAAAGVSRFSALE